MGKEWGRTSGVWKVPVVKGCGSVVDGANDMANDMLNSDEKSLTIAINLCLCMSLARPGRVRGTKLDAVYGWDVGLKGERL